MKKLIVWMFILISIFSLIPTGMPIVKATPSSWYVATAADHGSDSNSGRDITHPLLTLQKAINRSANSDTIYVRRGVYTYHHLISVNRSGTSTQYFTIKNYNGERPIIDGTYAPHNNCLNSSLQIKGTRSYIRITGLTFSHSYKGGITLFPTQSHVRIDNCTIQNCSSFAIKLQQASHCSIENCYIYNNMNNWSTIGISQETISIESSNYCNIYRNYLYKNHCENIDLKGSTSWSNVYRNRINTTSSKTIKAGCVYYGGPGVMLDTQGYIEHNISVYKNLIYGNNSGITIDNEQATNRYENISVYNNIINITNQSGGAPDFEGRIGILIARFGGSTAVNKDIKIYMNTVNLGTNNIYNAFQMGSVAKPLYKNYIRRLTINNNIFTISRSTSPYYGILTFYGLNITDGATYISLNNNLYNDSIAGQTPRISWTDGTYTKSSPTKWGNHPLFTKPKYKSPHPPFNFQLNSTSPCIDAATSSLHAPTDVIGIARPQVNGYDIGAYEYHS